MKTTYKVHVDGQTIDFHQPKVTGREILLEAGKTPVECYTLYQKLKGCDFEKISLDEVVNIADKQIEEFITKEPEIFHYTINGEPEMTDQKEMTPDQILKAAGIDHNYFYLVQVMPDSTKKEYAYQPRMPIKMLCTGLKFLSEKWLDVAVIEEFGKHCNEVPPARIYRFRVGKLNVDWAHPTIPTKEIIIKSGRTPVEDFEVLKFTSKQAKPELVKTDEVDLREKCITHFVVSPKSQDDGRELRKQFTLPAEDVEFLNGLGLPWETFTNGNHWLVIEDYPIPEGYNVQKAQIALMIPAQYDAVQIDMASFFPPLVKNSGTVIPNATLHFIDGRQFQQWSRHRKVNEWIPGVDNISTHLALVDNWLRKDLNR